MLHVQGEPFLKGQKGLIYSLFVGANSIQISSFRYLDVDDVSRVSQRAFPSGKKTVFNIKFLVRTHTNDFSVWQLCDGSDTARVEDLGMPRFIQGVTFVQEIIRSNPNDGAIALLKN